MFRLRKLVAFCLGILLIASGFYAFSPMLPGIPRAHASNVTIALDGRVNGWNFTTNSNPTITVHQGDTVSLKLSSGDGASHQFLLDVDRDGFSDTSDCPAVDQCSSVFSTSTTLTFTASFAPGTYTYYCTIHPFSMFGSFVIIGPPDYSLSGSPTSVIVGQGSSASSTISVSSMSGFTGAVSLSAVASPSGLMTTMSPNSVTVPSNGKSNATLTISPSFSTSVGNYTVTITGTNGTTSRLATVQATIEQGIGFRQSMIFSGANSTISGNFAVNTSLKHLTGKTTLTVINSTTGAPIFSKTVSSDVPYSSQGKAHFLDDIPTSPYWISTNCAVDIGSSSVSCFATRTPDITHSGAVNINDVSIIYLQFGQMKGSPNFNPEADLQATGRVDIIDVSIIGLYFGATVIFPTA